MVPTVFIFYIKHKWCLENKKSPLRSPEPKQLQQRNLIWEWHSPLIPNHMPLPLCFTRTGHPFVLLLVVGSEILNWEEGIRYQVRSTFF